MVPMTDFEEKWGHWLIFGQFLQTNQPEYQGKVIFKKKTQSTVHFMIDYDYMDLKDDKNRWAQIGSLERFHL